MSVPVKDGGDTAGPALDPKPEVLAARRDIEVVNVSKSYGGPDAVSDVSFTLQQGEFLSLLGPSGSGKSTTLLMVAGFERPTSGDIRLGGQSIIDQPPHRRNLGIVFQSYALFPHMSVIENVEFPLRMRGVPLRDRRGRARTLVERIGLAGLESRRPNQLSGGQQQRVALARALVFEPDALLLDEPLGALDRRLRQLLQLEIKELHRRTGLSVLYVTHDQEEAMTMSDRIAVMRDGRIVQVGSPEDVYHHPVTAFVAQFLGDTNLIPCTSKPLPDGSVHVTYRDGTHGVARGSSTNFGGDGPVQIAVRPEHVRPLYVSDGSQNDIQAVVSSRTFIGSHVRYSLGALGQQIIMDVTKEPARLGPLRTGDGVRVGWSSQDAQLLAHDAR